MLNGAVLMFDKGSRFIYESMVEFNTTYRIDSWGWNGPELVTRVAGRFPRGAELRILPTIAFYPIHWAKVAKYFTGGALPPHTHPSRLCCGLRTPASGGFTGPVCKATARRVPTDPIWRAWGENGVILNRRGSGRSACGVGADE